MDDAGEGGENGSELVERRVAHEARLVDVEAETHEESLRSRASRRFSAPACGLLSSSLAGRVQYAIWHHRTAGYCKDALTVLDVTVRRRRVVHTCRRDTCVHGRVASEASRTHVSS